MASDCTEGVVVVLRAGLKYVVGSQVVVLGAGLRYVVSVGLQFVGFVGLQDVVFEVGLKYVGESQLAEVLWSQVPQFEVGSEVTEFVAGDWANSWSTLKGRSGCGLSLGSRLQMQRCARSISWSSSLPLRRSSRSC